MDLSALRTTGPPVGSGRRHGKPVPKSHGSAPVGTVESHIVRAPPSRGRLHRRVLMELPAETVRRVLRRQPVPALPIDELCDLVRREAPGRVFTPEVVALQLRVRPDLFRVVDPWKGPWSPVNGSGGPPIGPSWVIPVERHEPPGEPRGPGRIVWDSLACLGEALDEESPTALARWLRIVREGRVVLQLLEAPRAEGVRPEPLRPRPPRWPRRPAPARSDVPGGRTPPGRLRDRRARNRATGGP